MQRSNSLIDFELTFLAGNNKGLSSDKKPPLSIWALSNNINQPIYYFRRRTYGITVSS